MKEKKVYCVLIGLTYDEVMDTPLILLRESRNGKIFSLPIGTFEASAMVSAADHLVSSVPQAYEIMDRLFRRHGFAIKRLELQGNPLLGYACKLIYKKGFATHTIDICPSGGIALASQLRVPVFAEPSLVEEADRADAYFSSPEHKNEHILYLDLPEQRNRERMAGY
ncbi:bifunctional nuclease family protein [Treponema sp. OttesenSCG-928-L16]|nr:bifunctional nuclease family protein [Treponema sp. OttesenSCG-928-L16]